MNKNGKVIAQVHSVIVHDTPEVVQKDLELLTKHWVDMLQEDSQEEDNSFFFISEEGNSLNQQEGEFEEVVSKSQRNNLTVHNKIVRSKKNKKARQVSYQTRSKTTDSKSA